MDLGGGLRVAAATFREPWHDFDFGYRHIVVVIGAGNDEYDDCMGSGKVLGALKSCQCYNVLLAWLGPMFQYNCYRPNVQCLSGALAAGRAARAACRPRA